MAKIVVKPTSAEQKIIDKRLRKKYPQMYEPWWGDAKLMAEMVKARRRRAKVEKKKGLTTTRTKTITNRLQQAGLTEAEINRLRGKK